MSVRDKRDGVTQCFSAARAATAAMHGLPPCADAEKGADDAPTLTTNRRVVLKHSPAGVVTSRVRTGSRSDLLLHHSPCTVSAVDRFMFTGKGCCSAALSLDAECLRRESFLQLTEELRAAVDSAASAVSCGASAGAFMGPSQLEELPARWVMQSLAGLPDAPAAADEVDSPAKKNTFELLSRDHVTALDVGATVIARENNDCGHRAVLRGVIVKTAPMSAGQYWVDVAVDDEGADEAERTVLRLDRETVRLHPPAATHLDAFLPCDDAFSPRGTSGCLYLAALLAAKGTSIAWRRDRQPRGGNGNDADVRAETVAARLATRLAKATHCARKELSQRLLALASTSAAVATARGGATVVASVEGTDNDVLTLHYCTTPSDAQGRNSSASLSVQLLRRTAVKLARMYDIAAQRRDGASSPIFPLLESFFNADPSSASSTHSTSPALNDYFTRLMTMLLRYRLLFGDKGYNQGPQAAIPPSVMAALHDNFDVRAEAFASPLNSHLPMFGSLFPDTDCFFGSIGSFFDVDFLSGHIEVNPPFDAVVIEKMEHRLLEGLTKAEEKESLLFVVVLPSHDSDSHEAPAGPAHNWQPLQSDDNGRKRPRERSSKASTERTLRESRFCLAHTLCAAKESAYVDGHQHVLRAPFFLIGTPTRLIVLGNKAAKVLYPDAQQRLEKVRSMWRHLTTSELR